MDPELLVIFGVPNPNPKTQLPFLKQSGTVEISPLVNGPKMTKIDQNRPKTGFSGQIRDK